MSVAKTTASGRRNPHEQKDKVIIRRLVCGVGVQ